MRIEYDYSYFSVKDFFRVVLGLVRNFDRKGGRKWKLIL